MENLSKEELKRYNRQLILAEIGIEGQQKLKAARILFIGAGGLGCPALQYFAAAGIGKLGIIDHDDVSISNLHRQILFNADDIGKNKAVIAAERLKQLNLHIQVESFPLKLTAENAAEILKDYDLLVDGSDNFPTRYLINDICVEYNKPWVFGSLFKFEGQVAVFNYKGSPVYRDVYPDMPEEGSVPNCSEIGIIGVLPGIIALLMANEVIKLICGIGETLVGKLLVFDALQNNMNVFQLAKSDAENVNSTSQIMSEEKVIEIDVSEIEKPNHPYFIVDVREEWEFEDFNKGGVNIPLSSLPAKLDELATANNIVCCCNYGNKSKIAVKLITDQYPDKKVYSIKNGIEEY